MNLRCRKGLTIGCLICNGGLERQACGSMGNSSHTRGSKAWSNSNATCGCRCSQILQQFRFKITLVWPNMKVIEVPVIVDPTQDFLPLRPRLLTHWPELVLERQPERDHRDYICFQKGEKYVSSILLAMKQRLTKCIKYCNNDIKSASVSQKKAGAESSNLDSFLLELYSYHALSSRTAKIISDKNSV